jgi:tetratricopeptide (TPR) repeat protein
MVRSPFAIYLISLFACGLCFCAAASAQSAGDLASLRRIWAVAEAGDNARALQQAREFIQTSPLSAEALDLAGVLATRLGFLEEAGESLWRALRIRPDSARLRSNLGYVYVRKGNASEAILHFRASLWLEPSFPDAWQGLAAAFALLGDKQAQEVARGLTAPSDKSGSACVRMADLLKRGAVPTTRLVTAFEGGPCDMDGPSLFLADLPAVLKFDRAALLMLRFREGSNRGGRSVFIRKV